MTLADYADFVFGATASSTGSAEGARMRRYTDRFDAAETVRIVGPGTDLTLSLAGRAGHVDDGHYNMPGGEFFYSPLEDSAEGVIEFSEFPAALPGRDLRGRPAARSRAAVSSKRRRRANEEFLIWVRSTPTRARAGSANSASAATPASSATRATSLFDEKIDGTVHLAVGAGLGVRRRAEPAAPSTGTWSRSSGRAGGSSSTAQVVQENGAWAL